MPNATLVPLPDALSHWHDFYALVGAAAATMIGLLFVAASVAGGVFSANRRAASRVFLSASVVNFSTVLAASLIVLAPVGSWLLLGVLVVVCGLCGLVHTGLAYRDTVRDGLIVKIDLEDRTWYLLMPAVAYLFEAGTGGALALRLDEACIALALAVGWLMLIGIHNAWDITVWTVTRRRD